MSSVVRWLTLFGHGYMQLSRAEQALDFYERALQKMPENFALRIQLEEAPANAVCADVEA